eukprot:2496951-Rhodomonas_salina.1
MGGGVGQHAPQVPQVPQGPTGARDQASPRRARRPRTRAPGRRRTRDLLSHFLTGFCKALGGGDGC